MHRMRREYSLHLIAFGSNIDRLLMGCCSQRNIVRPQFVYDAAVLNNTFCANQHHVHPAGDCDEDFLLSFLQENPQLHIQIGPYY